MKYTEAERLRAEIGTVEGFLAATPEDSVLERMSWESRLAVLRERLSEIESSPQAYPLSITFRGAPVEGMRSIDATFASEAVKAFVDATDTIAASLLVDLSGDGRLPRVRERSLRIVSTAVGSFGFEMELPAITREQTNQEQLFTTVERDPHVQAVDAAMDLLREAATDDEDAISDLVAEMHPRAAKKVRVFAEILRKNDALFALAFRNRQVRFDSELQVKKVVESLADSDISESDETDHGTILGILPESRQFEARLVDGEIIHGKVDRALTEITRFKDTWENRPAQLSFRVVSVRTRSRHILRGAKELDEDPELQTASP